MENNMATIVEIKNRRLIIKKSGRLVLDKNGPFCDADTNNRFIVALLENGRIQLFRLDGTFIKDISAKSEGRQVKILPDDTVIWTDGGSERKCNVENLYKSSTVNLNNKSFKDAHSAEELGVTAANYIFDKLKIIFGITYKKIKNNYDGK